MIMKDCEPPSENLSKEEKGMSRIGRMPVVIPAGVTVDVKDGNVVTVKGAKGELTRQFAPEMKITVQEVEKEIDEKTVKVNEILVERPNDLKREKSLHGLTRSLLQNMVTGVSDGYKKTLEINGVGYRAAKSGKKLTLNLGYSHPIEMDDPEGIETAVDGNKIVVSGIDKEKVGQYAAQIREKRGPEPYKGKGIKYDYEIIRRKVGKTGK
jgi:large subunit ribosomal protein L6